MMHKMKRYKKFFENMNFKDSDEVKLWVNSLTIPTRKPTSISKVEHTVMLKLYKFVTSTEYDFNEDFRNTLIMQMLPQLRLDKEEYESIYSNNKNQPDTIKGKYATYKHNDTGSYKRFLDNVENIEDLLSELKGYHKLALKNLTVEFVSSKEMKTPARYKSGKKTMWINPLSKKVGNTKEEYGSLRYIVVHELGHKFLEEHKQNWNISDPSLYTTKYSMTNPQTMTEEESFAELFALSHWKSKYKQYKNQIQEFERRLNK